MSILNKITKLSKISLKPIKRAALIVGTASGTGAAVGYSQSQPGLRAQGAKEGAVIGAGLAAGGLYGGKIIFRRIRGKLRPIRVKK